MFLRHFARYSPLILPAKIFLAHFHNVILEGEKKKKEEKSNVTPRRNYFPHFQFTPSTCSNPPSALHCPRSGGGRWKFMESENFSENSRLAMGSSSMCTCKFILNETRQFCNFFFELYIFVYYRKFLLSRFSTKNIKINIFHIFHVGIISSNSKSYNRQEFRMNFFNNYLNISTKKGKTKLNHTFHYLQTNTFKLISNRY